MHVTAPLGACPLGSVVLLGPSFLWVPLDSAVPLGSVFPLGSVVSLGSVVPLGSVGFRSFHWFRWVPLFSSYKSIPTCHDGNTAQHNTTKQLKQGVGGKGGSL